MSTMMYNDEKITIHGDFCPVRFPPFGYDFSNFNVTKYNSHRIVIRITLSILKLFYHVEPIEIHTIQDDMD